MIYRIKPGQHNENMSNYKNMLKAAKGTLEQSCEIRSKLTLKQL